jgi:hypothetical protein
LTTMPEAAAGDAESTIREARESLTHCLSLDRFAFMIIQVRSLIAF